MMVRIYGFDWEAYSSLIMPAFSRWLVEGDETTIKQLFEHTHCAREEQFIPAAMQSSATWPRAQALVKQLHHSEQADKEYTLLCSAEQFTAQSDSYVHHYTPQLHVRVAPVRIIWGTVLEEYCLSWFTLPTSTESEEIVATPYSAAEQKKQHSELALLLQSAGLHELAHAMSEKEVESVAEDTTSSEHEKENAITSTERRGIAIGRHPMTLHLRGWLATRMQKTLYAFWQQRR
jgi:hypothetical protein